MNKKSAISLVLAGVLLSGLPTNVSATQNSENESIEQQEESESELTEEQEEEQENELTEEQKKELEKQLKKQQQELEDMEKELEAEKAKYEELADDIRDLERELEERGIEYNMLLQDINEVQEEIADKQEEIKELKEDIERIKEEIEDEEIKYAGRLRGMYISGSTSFLDIILGSQDVSGLFTRTNAIQSVMEYDTELLANMEGNKLALEEAMIKVEQEEAELADLEDRLKDQIEEAEKIREENEKLLDEFNEKNEEYIKTIANLEWDIIRKEIDIEQTIAQIEGEDYIGNNSSIEGMKAVESAKKYLGVPYLWGGEKMDGIDCSGLTMMAYRDIGINISRTTWTQVKDGQPVEKSELQVGDLVFYSPPRRDGTIEYLGHVGMYTGNGRMIHASSSRGVIEQDISVYWGQYYETAVRILN